jgi:hypothetical protein
VESVCRNDGVREIQSVEEFGEHGDLVRFCPDVGLAYDQALLMGHRCQQVHLGTFSVHGAADLLPVDGDGRQVLLFTQVRPGVTATAACRGPSQ